MRASLDGYVADEAGNFDWADPDTEVHAFVNDLARPIGTFIFGRSMYEVLLAWEAPPDLDQQPLNIQDFAAIWHAADKVVYSRTLETPASARTRTERAFDPAAVRALKARAERDLAIGGPQLAGQALAAGLVDELQLLVAPVVVGGGTALWPRGVRLPLALRDERRFASGFAYLRYDVVV